MKSLSRVQLSNPMDCSPPGSSVHGIFQARVLPHFKGIWASEKLGKVPPDHHKAAEEPCNLRLFFSPLFILFSFLFCIGVQPINSVVIISGGQQRDSSIQYPCIHSPPNSLPCRLPHTLSRVPCAIRLVLVEYSSLYLYPQKDSRLGLVPL